MIKQELLLDSIVQGIKQKKAEDIVKLDLTNLHNTFCDHFIICQAGSERLVQAIADSAEEYAFTEAKEKPINKTGYTNAEWVLLDYGDIVVHIFKNEFREIYNLEELWSEADLTKIENTYSTV
jgi:ribosome-associated protein